MTKGSTLLALRSPSVSGAAKSLNIPDATLHTWVQKAKQEGNCIVANSEGDTTQVNVAAILKENKELNKRLARLEQEKAILKKAATYFAKELG